MKMDPEEPKSLCPSVLELPLRQRNFSLKRMYERTKETSGRAYALFNTFVAIVKVGGSSLAILGLTGYGLMIGIPACFKDKEALDGNAVLIGLGIILFELSWIAKVNIAVMEGGGTLQNREVKGKLDMPSGHDVVSLLVTISIILWILSVFFPVSPDEKVSDPSPSRHTIFCIIICSVILAFSQIAFYLHVLMVIIYACDFKTVEEDTPCVFRSLKKSYSRTDDLKRMGKQLRKLQKQRDLLTDKIIKRLLEGKDDKGDLMLSSLIKPTNTSIITLHEDNDFKPVMEADKGGNKDVVQQPERQ